MPAAVRALRGATTFDVDEIDHVTSRVVDLVTQMLAQNDVDHDDIISILFTATDDLSAVFPATAARTIGLGDVPLICARELAITGATKQCIRVMMHLETERSRSELRHVYLEGATTLRDDLPE
jgi:chorismate mutase